MKYYEENFEAFLEKKLLEKEIEDEPFDGDKIPKSILWQELDQKVFDQQSWRIKNLIPKQGFVILASISGNRKTWLAMEMAKSIVSNKKFLDYFETEGCNVLYINGENSESEMQRRGRQPGFNSGINSFNLHIINSDDLNLNKTEGSVWLKAFIEFYEINVVFIDTFIATAGGLKEDKSDEIRQFFNRFNSLKNNGVSVVWLMHLRKPNNFEGKTPKKEQLLGSQDKSASVEVLLMLHSEAGSEEINVYQRKNRLNKEEDPFKVNMKDKIDETGTVRTVLEYAGMIEEQENKKEQAKDIIIEILENGEKTTNQILDLTKKLVGSKNTRTALKELVNDKLIEFTRHKGDRQNYYFLPKENGEIKNELDLF